MGDRIVNCARQGAILVALYTALLLPCGAFAESGVESKRFVTMPITELLRVLSAADSKDPAVARITLRSGTVFEGIITQYEPEKGVCVVADDRGATSVVNVGDVSAVTILRAGAAKVALQGGKIYPDAAELVPSFILLRRQAEELSTKYKTRIVVNLPESEKENRDCRFAAARLLESLEKILSGVAADAAGRESLASYAEGVLLQHRPGGSLSVDGASKKNLVVQFDCLAPLDATYDADFSGAINQVL